MAIAHDKARDMFRVSVWQRGTGKKKYIGSYPSRREAEAAQTAAQESQDSPTLKRRASVKRERFSTENRTGTNGAPPPHHDSLVDDKTWQSTLDAKVREFALVGARQKLRELDEEFFKRRDEILLAFPELRRGKRDTAILYAAPDAPEPKKRKLAKSTGKAWTRGSTVPADVNERGLALVKERKLSANAIAARLGVGLSVVTRMRRELGIDASELPKDESPAVKEAAVRREARLADLRAGMTLKEVAAKHGVSRALVGLDAARIGGRFRDGKLVEPSAPKAIAMPGRKAKARPHRPTGNPKGRGDRKQTHLTPELVEKIDALRTTGKGYRAIAKELGADLWAVRRHVRQARKREAVAAS